MAENEVVEEKKEKKKKKSIPKDGGDKKTTKKAAAEQKAATTADDGNAALAAPPSPPLEPPLEPPPQDETVPKRKSLHSVEDVVEISDAAASNEVENNVDEQEKSAMDVINEIFNPPLMEFDTTKPYDVPVAVKAGDVNALQDLDERKIIELKEAFLLFDLDGDGCIDANDLRGTFGTLGEYEVPEGLVEQMLSEAMDPLDFDAFVMLLGYKTIEMDPEDVLLEALSKWDLDKKGVIDEDKLRHDLTCYGDRFTEKEANYALEEAPLANKNRAPGETPLIDYPGFCRLLSGFRKRKTAPPP